MVPGDGHMKSAEWLAARKTGVGGSDLGAVFSVDYGCRKALWYERRDVPSDFPQFSGNRLTELGEILEPKVAAWYTEETGRQAFEVPSAIHPDHPEIRVNADRIIVDPARGEGVLEIKTQNRALFYKTKREGLSQSHILQLHQGMLVHDKPWGAFAVANRENGELVHFDMDRSEALCAEILHEVPAFWNQVIHGPAPDALPVDDPRCGKCPWRTQCQGAALVQLPGDSEITPAPELLPLLTERNERKAMFDQAEELLGETVEEIKTKLGARQAVMVGKAKIYYRQQAPRTNIQGKELLETYKKVRAGLAETLKSDAPDATDEEIESALVQVGAVPAERFVEMGKGARPLRFY